MATELIMRREGQALRARDPHSHELLMGITAGVDVMARVTQPRNPAQHRLVWALVKLIADNHPDYSNPAEVMRHLKMLAGLVNEFPGVNPRTGEAMIYYEVQSLSWATMDQIRFSQVFPSLMHAAVKHMLPGITSDTVHSEILEMVG